jgi:hypothetical protein
MGAVLFSSFRVLRGARAPLEEYSSLGDYSMTVEGWSGDQDSSKQLPSADEIANSMYGGSEELFQQPPPPPGPVEQILESPQEAIGPPVPESGLPEGWTMEQWQYYGKDWLESQKE